MTSQPPPDRHARITAAILDTQAAQMLPPLEFTAGVYLLTPAQDGELERLMAACTDDLARILTASQYVRTHTTPAERQRVAAAIRSGELRAPGWPPPSLQDLQKATGEPIQ